jgi:hypothetical protein
MCELKINLSSYRKCYIVVFWVMRHAVWEVITNVSGESAASILTTTLSKTLTERMASP